MSHHDLLLHTAWGRQKIVLPIRTQNIAHVSGMWKYLFNSVTVKQMVLGCVSVCGARFGDKVRWAKSINQHSWGITTPSRHCVCVCVCVCVWSAESKGRSASEPVEQVMSSIRKRAQRIHNTYMHTHKCTQPCTHRHKHTCYCWACLVKSVVSVLISISKAFLCGVSLRRWIIKTTGEYCNSNKVCCRLLEIFGASEEILKS